MEQDGELLSHCRIGQRECSGLVDRDHDRCPVAEGDGVLGRRWNHDGRVRRDHRGGQSASRIAAHHVDLVAGLQMHGCRRIEDPHRRQDRAGIEAGEQLTLNQAYVGQGLASAHRPGQRTTERRLGRIQRAVGDQLRRRLDEGDILWRQHGPGSQIGRRGEDDPCRRRSRASGLNRGHDRERCEDPGQRAPPGVKSAPQVAADGMESGPAHATDRRRAPAIVVRVVHSLSGDAEAGQVEEPAFAVSFDDEPLEAFESLVPLELEPESLPDELVPESLDDFDLVLAPSLPFWPARLSVR